jgi:CPA1 family monovalent cation:H+ antiporter
VHVALALAALVSVIVATSALCGRLGAPAPLVLVAIGAAASFVPFVPEVRLSAEVVLVGLLPPLLYSAALQSSLVDFNANRRAILLLSVGLVVFTTLGVGLVVHLVLPDIGWPAAFALGAVVSPPDAVSTSAIARRVGMPRRIVTILEGESLLNDATALVALRTAIGAASATVSVAEVGLDFFRAAVGGVGAGLLVYVVVAWLRKRLTEPVLDTSVSFVVPFLAYLLAEAVHASGVLAVVVAGLLLGHRAPVLQNASSRISSRLTWKTIAFLLENAVFLLIGLQARRILADVAAGGVAPAVVVSTCAATLLAVVLLRLLWVLPARFLLMGTGADAKASRRPPWAYTLVIGWAGIRGVVTLAAAFAIPAGVPDREVLVLVALVVTGATLFLQGTTLPWLVRRLRLPSPDPREDALARAALFDGATAAGLARLAEHDGDDDGYGIAEQLRRRVEQRDQAAWERLGGTALDSETPSERYSRLRLEMLAAERAKVLEVRDSGRVPHQVVEEVLAALDVEESMLDAGAELRTEVREAPVTGMTHQPSSCAHLRDAPTDTVPNVDGVCEDCVAEGLDVWVHLRTCLSCGHVGCCDSSPRKHATAHFDATGHPVIRSAEPLETWRWCYVDGRLG